MARTPLDLLPLKVKFEHMTAERINELGGLRSERVPSDKIGFDWIIEYVGEAEIMRTYVPTEIPIGTADNPIPYSQGLLLIPNAYYTLDGVRKVWMGINGVSAAWDDDMFVEF